MCPAKKAEDRDALWRRGRGSYIASGGPSAIAELVILRYTNAHIIIIIVIIIIIIIIVVVTYEKPSCDEATQYNSLCCH